MKNFLLSLLLVAAVLPAMGQNYPSEWSQYTSDSYFHDVESATDKQNALDRARTNLARQVQVRVSEVSQMDKQVVNGRSSILYTSTQNLATDVDMDLAESRSYYNETQGKYYAIVFIDKAAACTYYNNEMRRLIGNAENTMEIAKNYVATGFKQKAKSELEAMLQRLGGMAKPFFWLNVFGYDAGGLQGYASRVQRLEQNAKQMLADLEYGTTYCVVCQADLFGKKYAKLANEVKGELSAAGCNFVDDPSKADYVIRINASARQYNTFQGAYFTYIDAAVSIDKNATGQRIYEDETSVKGSHTISYDEAARDGYKTISKEITKLLKENIKL